MDVDAKRECLDISSLPTQRNSIYRVVCTMMTTTEAATRKLVRAQINGCFGDVSS